jgi:hypothetical protein
MNIRTVKLIFAAVFVAFSLESRVVTKTVKDSRELSSANTRINASKIKDCCEYFGELNNCAPDRKPSEVGEYKFSFYCVDLMLPFAISK